MRERITYILRNPQASFNPDQLKATNTSFAVPGIEAAKEHQITLSSKELPQELWRVLRNCHELHIRWATPRFYQDIAPYVSRVTPGLHVFFTPLKGKSVKRLCSLLKDSFGKWIKCDSIEESFTTPPVLSERFSSSSSRQYFYHVPSIMDLVTFIQMRLCGEERYPCRLRAHELNWADYLDIDYDAVSQAFIVRGFWANSRAEDQKWYETNLKGSDPSDTLEVGVLMNEVPDEEEELRYSGFLTQVGHSKAPGSTLFSFPARHHPLPKANKLTYKASFNEPSGLHPTLSISFSTLPKPTSPACVLHAYLTLPSTLFLDKYPFSDPLFLKDHNLRALHALSGATDLEAPEWVMPTWGSASLFEIAIPESHPPSLPFTATIPLHLRYLNPANISHILLPVPWPNVFYSCPAFSSGSKFAAAPFDRVNLGYDGLFGPNTLFYHVPPTKPGIATADSRSVATLQVPVLDLQKAAWVEPGTMAVVLLGAIWVLWVLGKGVARSGYGRGGKRASVNSK